MYILIAKLFAMPFVVGGVEVSSQIENEIRPGSDWVSVWSYQLEEETGNIEIDLHLEVFRTGIFGTVIDFFFPSTTQISIVSDRNFELYGETIQGNSVSVSALVVPKKAKSIDILFKNRNTFFPISLVLSGEIASASDQFDLRAAFPACPFPVYSQQMCGACYADVVAGAGTDDLCISNNGKAIVDRLSPQPILSCASLGGCNGGSPYLAALWAQTNGLTKYDDCPYLSGQCSPVEDLDRDGCVKCKSVNIRFAPVYHLRPIILSPNSEYAIRKHIKLKGSVMVIFDAHANFQTFFSQKPFAVYTSHDNSPSLGNHAVRLIGFGVKDQTRYWIGLNSWGSTWANRGSFKILRGHNLCSIEQYPVGVESIHNPISGVTQANFHSHPTVGEWTKQDMEENYWKEFVENHTEEIHNLIGLKSFAVTSIETRVGNGYFVKIILRGDPKHKVIVHVSPEGASKVSMETKKRALPHPEKLDNVSLN